MDKRTIRDGLGFHQFKRETPTHDFPTQFSHYVRQFGDVYFWPKGNFHVVTRAELARIALTDPALSCDRTPFFLSRMPNMDLNLLTDFFSTVSKMMVMSDGELHRKRRTTATFGLSDKLLDGVGNEVKFIIQELIRRTYTSTIEGGIDFASDVAALIPSAILADLFLIPETDRFQFYEWSNTMTAFFGGATKYENEDGIKVNHAARQLQQYFVDQLSDSRNKPKKDFFSGMLEGAKRFGLDDSELISQAIMMLVAGQVTTADQMNNILYLLLTNPATLKEVQENEDLLPNMIEELSRLDPAVTFIFRVAKSRTQIAKQTIEPGETVFISSHAINRDEAEVSNPHSIDLHRKNGQGHFTYGFGAHHCMGARLARIELREVFQYLIQKHPKIRLGRCPSVRNHYSLSFSGFKTLSVEV